MNQEPNTPRLGPPQPTDAPPHRQHDRRRASARRGVTRSASAASLALSLALAPAAWAAQPSDAVPVAPAPAPAPAPAASTPNAPVPVATAPTAPVAAGQAPNAPVPPPPATTPTAAAEQNGWSDAAPAGAPPTPHPPAYTVPPPPVPPSRPPARDDAGLPMLVTGAAGFGAVYLLSSLIGAVSIDKAAKDTGSKSARRRAYGQRMLIPVGGPWAAIPVSQTASGAWFTALLGAAQATGVILTVAGAVRYARTHRAPRYTVAAAPTPSGGAVTFGMRF